MTNHYGSIEAGGTKFVLAIGDEQFNILKTNQIPTTSPEETITRTIEFFKENPVKSLAVGSFGPIDIKPESATYGYITTTPKAGWANSKPHLIFRWFSLLMLIARLTVK